MDLDLTCYEFEQECSEFLFLFKIASVLGRPSVDSLSGACRGVFFLSSGVMLSWDDIFRCVSNIQ